MKILVCVDGSAQSQKALAEAAAIAKGYNVDEVSVIHVHENQRVALYGEVPFATREHLEYYAELERLEQEKGKAVLEKAVRFLESKNLTVHGLFRLGHPATEIGKAVDEEGFDVVVIGSRGLGGLRKLFLGSVSNAVLQEVKANIYIVK